jgi:predicted dienelactone hydrolase
MQEREIGNTTIRLRRQILSCHPIGDDNGQALQAVAFPRQGLAFPSGQPVQSAMYLRTLRLVLCALFLLLAPVTASAVPEPHPDYKIKPGPHVVDTVEFTWTDASRGGRQIPVKIYLPQDGAGPLPVILVSHGLGGSRDTYAYLGRHWAGYGYVAVHVQHPGSDEAVWRGKSRPLEALRQTLTKPENALNRPKDMSFALDQLAGLNQSDARFRGRLNLHAVGAAGHSFGAWTVQALAGQAFSGSAGREIKLAEPRIRAGVIMSPIAPKQRSQSGRAFSRIHTPLLHLTGTRDDGFVTSAKAADRRLPYDHIAARDQYLITLRDGDHFTFVGPGRPRGGGLREERLWDLVRITTTAFWDTYLKGDVQGRAWLEQICPRALGTDGILERK